MQTTEPSKPAEAQSFLTDELGAGSGFSIVRRNLMTERGYTPYCGEVRCFNRTKFDGEQFKCSCGWRSTFPSDFIAGYKAKWHQTPNAGIQGSARSDDPAGMTGYALLKMEIGVECLLCGKNYINLGVHLRHKHHADPADYKEQFGLMKTTPLVDLDLSEHMSKSAKRRLLDPEYREEVVGRCLNNAKNNLGKSPEEMSKAGKNKLSARNLENHAKRLVELAPIVESILREKKTILDVRRDIGMGRNAVMKIVEMGKAVYSKDVALKIGTQRRVASRLKSGGA